MSSTPDGSDLPESICPLPWVNLSLDVDGSSRPCCKFAHLEPDSPYQMANLREHTLEEVWRGEGLQRLRADFRAGARPRECSTCWDEEAAGVQSYRQTFTRYRGLTGAVDFDDRTPPPPQAMDLKLTNACNLKCRICGPVASSLWLQEELATGEPAPRSFVAQLRDSRTYYLSNKLTHSPSNLATVRRWLPGLQYLELTGGEPMMSPENRELVELIASEGRPEQVGILFNTNATVIDDRILRHLPRFREVKICCSIDDTGARFEYERFPADWEAVERNLARYQEIDGLTLYAFCSVSVLNVWYLPEYVQWLRQRDDRRPMDLVLNYVHFPRHFSVQVLPEAVKQRLAQRLQAELLDDPSLAPELAGAVADLISFLGHGRSDDAAMWQQGVETIIERDRIRSQRFDATFPEWYEELVAAGAWTPTRSSSSSISRRQTRPLQPPPTHG